MTEEEKEAIKVLEKYGKECLDEYKVEIDDIENIDEPQAFYLRQQIEAVNTVLNMLKEKDKQIEKVLEIAFQYGQIDGDHHKTCVIDQIVRILTGEKYNEFVKGYETDEETGEKEWTWENGIAP